jgi:6-phosphogluconolactonase (cycloisomerase 2 family)
LKKTLFFLLFVTIANAQNISFEAKGMLYLQDGDFNSFSYSTGTIEKDKASSDKIVSFFFPLIFSETNGFSEQSISNATFFNKKSIALKSDNRLCYVLETKGQIKKEQANGVVNIKNLPDGNYVSVVDISNLRNLKADYRFPIGTNPTSISLNKSNEYLAVGSETYKQELQVFELTEFGKPIRMIPKPSLMSNGTVTDIEWHPNGDFLAYIKQDTKEVGLIKVVRDGPTQKIVRLEQFGNTIKMEGLPTTGSFTKDGKYFIVLDQKKDLLSKDASQNGQVFVIKFNYEDASNHFLISKLEVEENPTAITIHPNGKWILVVNSKKSYDFPININLTNQTSISVLNLNAEGSLSPKAIVKVEGILPTNLVFDKSGKNLAIGFFQYLSYGKSFGGIEFFKFLENSTPILEKQSSKIYTTKGIHYLKVIDDY